MKKRKLFILVILSILFINLLGAQITLHRQDQDSPIGWEDAPIYQYTEEEDANIEEEGQEDVVMVAEKTESSSDKDLSDLNDEINKLALKLVLIKENFDRLTSFYYFSFTIFITLFLIIFGFNYFSHKNQIKNTLEEKKAALETKYNEKIKELESKYTSLLDKYKKNISESFDYLTEKTTNDIETLESEFTEYIQEKIEDKIDPIQYDQNSIKIDILELKYNKDDADKITISLDKIKLALKNNWDWTINESLDHILQALANGEEIDSLDMADTIKILNKVPKTCELLRDKVLEQVINQREYNKQ